MGCCESFSKFLLIVINLIFLLASLLMLALGITLVVAPDKILSFAQSEGIDIKTLSEASGGFFNEVIKATGIFMIILGAAVTIIAFFGFFGACCENSCMLGTYAVLLIIIVLCEVALIIFAAVYPQVFRDKGSGVLVDALKRDFKSDAQITNGTFTNVTNVASAAWMIIQFKLQCCGARGYEDYTEFPWTRCGSECSLKTKVPISCCQLKDASKLPRVKGDFSDFTDCVSETPQESSINPKGCADTMIDKSTASLRQYSRPAIGIAAGIVGLEIILITLAFILCCRGRSSSKAL